jgi:thymidylate kinase
MKNYKNLFIICDGPDNVGKGTLIKNIQNYFNDYTLHVLHYSNVKFPSVCFLQQSTKLYIEMFQFMKYVNRSKKSGVICDRSHLGEMIYGPIYRNYDGEYVLDIEKKFSKYKNFWNKIILITLIDNPENLIKRDDGLSFSTNIKNKIIEIDNFKNAHNKSTIKNKLLIDISVHNEQQTLNSVVNFIDAK